LLKYFARGGDQIVRAVSGHKLLSVYAARRADRTLSLLVINKSPLARLQGHFSIRNFQPDLGATLFSYGIPQDEAARTEIGWLDIARTNIPGVATEFSHSFGPYSATVIRLSPQKD